jgi:hypothetical protein
MPQPFDAVNRLVQRIMKPLYGGHIIKRLAGMTPPAPEESGPVATPVYADAAAAVGGA